MNCYAPMFVNVNPGARQWRPNLVGCDALRVYASPSATNAIDTPERVVPVTSTVTGVESGFTYTVPKHGIVVLTMRTR